ncbi:VWA domain-containing protein [Micromonospora sp. RTGN7]|uniref:VWA domain-containing protein n=1 Tax=Micromonospora sp. RTGN7 TaxID=3016526 RepID=UPI0029FEDB87|nr:VWA domain-containing protein [Micromonospora sp. RTGN7]
MPSRLDFDLRVDHDRFLSTKDRHLHAILTVAARAGAADAGGRAAGAGHAEVIVIDCSESMAYPRTKITAARRATAAAVGTLTDGIHFAVVEGTHEARTIYPRQGGLAVSSPTTRAEARQAVGQLVAAGGTAIGTWLELARELLATHPTAIRHALLLTDGRNEHETPQRLAEVLAGCAGQFVCDARGVGDAWEPRELMRVAEALHGTADAVRRPAELEADFRETMRAAMAKQVARVHLRIDLVPPARVLYCRQAHPTVMDLPIIPLDARTAECATGSWGEESREYHLCLEVDGTDRPKGEDLRVGRVDLRVDDVPAARPVNIQAHWTDDLMLSSRIDPRVAHYTGQEELGQLIADGCDEYDRGDREAALGLFGRAVELATAAGDAFHLEQLGLLVDGIGTGTIRLRDNLTRLDVINVAVQSSVTMHDGGPESVPSPPARADSGPRLCRCGHRSPPVARFCERCGERLPTGDEAGPVPA